MTNCTKCHELGKKVSANLCLQCHDLLRTQIENRKGLHANAEFKNCVDCHVDHQGRRFEMIFWKNGVDDFDHNLTGYQLEGKHQSLKCRDCHQGKNIRNKSLLLKNNKALDRTYLGLNAACLSCHFDEHRAQLKSSCLDCHTQNRWKPAEKFTHQKARFKLTGKHSNVSCEKCHPLVRDRKNANDVDYVKYTGIRFNQCTACHADVHKNKFGQDCESCHSTLGWHRIKGNKFDHDQTRYPLRGRHASVSCEKCHTPQRKFANLRFQNCTDCHTDYHRGQFKARAPAGACEECHTVEEFSPSGFTIQQHQETNYPLTGSHLAIPCSACHQKVRFRANIVTIQFKFKTTKCDQCHEDFHKGELNKYVLKSGCEFCHNSESWKDITYDHSQTGFALEGQHKLTGCLSCHKPMKRDVGQSPMKFVGLFKECQGCHEDIHAGQFREEKISARIKKNFTRCERCHIAEHWRADKFIHNRDAQFRIDGEHRYVACGECHKKKLISGNPIVIYKPVDSECRACHNQNPEKLKLKNG
ncbi:cytochrome c3 family protein [candidate division KSB1 bacterium]|nr:cytochrome c3 family protein [candidate division KSB1 bacterium]